MSLIHITEPSLPLTVILMDNCFTLLGLQLRGQGIVVLRQLNYVLRLCPPVQEEEQLF